MSKSCHSEVLTLRSHRMGDIKRASIKPLRDLVLKHPVKYISRITRPNTILSIGATRLFYFRIQQSHTLTFRFTSCPLTGRDVKTLLARDAEITRTAMARRRVKKGDGLSRAPHMGPMGSLTSSYLQNMITNGRRPRIEAKNTRITMSIRTHLKQNGNGH
jgi:hypothetical protein